jgi:nitrilase
MPRIAIVQQPPVFLDRARTIDAVVSAARESADAGAELVVFPEAFIPGYPAWIWRLRPGTDGALSTRLHTMLLAQAVRLDGADLAPVTAVAKERRVTIVCGMHERDTEHGGGTLYNTCVVIGPDGSLLNRHRKVMPTHPERMVWGFGDASGMRAIATPCGRVGTLICWESYMPLARFALYAQGLDVYVAPTYDAGDTWIATMQHVAREGGCWVLGAGCAFQAKHVPDGLPGKAELYPDPEEWINPGDSVVVAPGGKIVAGPLRNALGIVHADVDLDRVGIARRTLDTVGHYSRPDLFRLQVDARPQTSIDFRAPDA